MTETPHAHALLWFEISDLRFVWNLVLGHWSFSASAPRWLAQRYPRWKDFLEVRASLDPEAKMLNPYLKKVFGVA